MNSRERQDFAPLRFGKYLLLERVGRGGMAEVYRAKTYGPAGFEKEFALKKILPTLVEDADFIAMFIDEAKLSVSLTHPNIVQTFDLGQIDGHYYIAMEFVSGKDLLDLLASCSRRKTRIPIDVALFIAMEVLRGLDFAHRATDRYGEPLNITHRDVSPSNVLLAYSGAVKVGDFGIAKSEMQSNRTENGIQKGKLGYMSPEQVAALPVSPRSDIFSAGIILFEMLTMSRLFKAKNDLDVMLRIRDGTGQEDAAKADQVAPELREVLARALERDPEKRYPTGEDFLVALQEFALRHGIRTSSSRVSAFMREVFAEKIDEERQHRAQDPTAPGGFDAVGKADVAAWRYRDAEGQIHGPMKVAQMEELLRSRASNAAERVSYEDGEWMPPGRFVELAPAQRPLPPPVPGVEEASDPTPTPGELDARRGRDWEEMGLAGVNPRKKKRPESERNASSSLGEALEPPRAGAAEDARRPGPAAVRSEALVVPASIRPGSGRGEPRPAARPAAERPFGSGGAQVRQRPAAGGGSPRPGTKGGATVGLERPQSAQTGEGSGSREPEATAARATQQGQLSNASFVRILHRLHLRKATGKLLVQSRDSQKEIYFRSGVPSVVLSSRPEELLGNFLVSRGVVTQAQLDQALAVAREAGGRLGDILIQSRVLAPHMLFQVLSDQLGARLADMFNWDGARWAWFPDVAPPGDALPLDVNVQHVIVSGVHEQCDLPFLHGFFRKQSGRPLHPMTDRANTLDLKLTGRELRAAHMIEPGDTIEAAVQKMMSRARWTEREAYQAVFLLTELELFRFRGEPEPPLPG